MNIASDFQPVGVSSEEIYDHLKLARENEPIFFSETFNCWVITHYEDVVSIVMNPKDFITDGALNGLNDNYCEKSNKIIEKGIDWRIVHHLQNTEGDDHTRVRDLVQKIISPDRVKRMEPLIRRITVELVDKMLESNKCEFVTSFSYPLPVLTIFRIIGFDESKEDMPLLQRWSDNTLRLFLAPMEEEEEVQCAKDAIAFQEYIREKIVDCRKNPKNDLLTDLVNEADCGESNFSDEELILLFTLNLIGAGHSTTLVQLSNMFHQLLKDRVRWKAIIDDPTLIHDTVEEMLRFAPATLGWFRVAASDVDFKGHHFKKGDLIFMSIGSANRDERKFENAEEFCPVRKDRVRSMTFTQGKHACPGSALARMELYIALEEISRRIPGLRLNTDQKVVYGPSLAARMIPELFVEWD
ncbi:MAG: cytochrome P450 [Paraglaciecola sp.]|jgi:cytochrome P450